MPKRAIETPKAKAVGPYSMAIEAGDYVYLSGQTPMDPATGKLVQADIGAETKQCLENLRNVLEAAGLTFANVVKSNVFLTNMGDFAAMNEVYKAYFPAPFPARSTVAVAALPLGARVEIELVAYRGK
jgi:2-iminobutanoate/2-iminopropanoate deaminase